MALLDGVRAHAEKVAAEARWVRIDLDALALIDPGADPPLDTEMFWTEGTPEDVTRWVLIWDSVNFGSGWFPTVRKRPGRSGSLTVASALADHARLEGVWPAAELRALDPSGVARVLGQEPDHELMALYARALNDLGTWLADRSALEVVPTTAEQLAADLARGMPFFRDVGFYKRAQITAADLHLAGVASFPDLDRLTIFADNLVPHVLRVDGALVFAPALTERIDAGEPLAAGSREEVEIRACGLQACELLAQRLGIPPWRLDNRLWWRGQEPRYKAVPRHRAHSVYY
jgi:Queuosine salvage protein